VAELRKASVRELPIVADNPVQSLIENGDLKPGRSNDPSLYPLSSIQLPEGTARDILSDLRTDKVA